jgi:hypothetical protein
MFKLPRPNIQFVAEIPLKVIADAKPFVPAEVLEKSTLYTAKEHKDRKAVFAAATEFCKTFDEIAAEPGNAIVSVKADEQTTGTKLTVGYANVTKGQIDAKQAQEDIASISGEAIKLFELTKGDEYGAVTSINMAGGTLRIRFNASRRVMRKLSALDKRFGELRPQDI